MSTLKIEERITVSAPPDRVWRFLLDPARVAGCLPGAKLDGTEGDSTFLGTMKVKVGPVMMEFKGKATMTEVAEAERRVVLTGTGNDKSGSGSARMAMTSHIVAKDDGGSEIVVVADVDLAGKLVSFGRGMMVGISKQLFKQFAERVHAELLQEGDDEEEAPEEPKADEPKAEEPKADEPKADEPKVEEPVAKTEEPEAKVEEAPAPEVKKEEPAGVVEEPPAPKAAPPKKAVAKKKKPSKSRALAAPQDNAPLDAGNLFFTAIWEWLKGLFRRLFGGK